jgi:hypothetical protein
LESLSKALWGETRFPYIFFFETERLDYSWITFLDHTGYERNFNPHGLFYHTKPERLIKHGGAMGFVKTLRSTHKI